MGANPVEQAATDLFAQRALRLEAVERDIIRKIGELVATKTAYEEQKANLYLSYPPSMSHGERQTRAGHEAVSMDTEVRTIMADLEQLREERDLLKFTIEFIA